MPHLSLHSLDCLSLRHVIRGLLCCIASGCALNAQAGTAANTPPTPYQLAWDVSADSYSPTQSITSFTDDWDEPLAAGDFAYIQARSDIAYRTASSPLSYGLHYRYDYLLSFSEPMAQTYWHYKNKSLPASARTYPLALSANHNERAGFGIGYDVVPSSRWQFTPMLNVWRGLHAVTGELQGRLTTLPATGQPSKLVDTVGVAHADLSYHYDTPALKEDRLGWQPARPDGVGYSLDLQITGELPYQTRVAINAYDILGKMHWRDMPMTDYTFDYDAMGRPPYTLEGKLATADITQDLPWRVETRLEKPLTPAWSVGLNSQFNAVSDLHQLTASYQLSHHQQPMTITAMVEPQTQAVGLQIARDDFAIRYLTDDLNTNRAKRVDLQLSLQHRW